MKNKITGGARYRKQKMNTRFKQLATFIIMVAAFLTFGALTGDIASGLALAALPVVVIPTKEDFETDPTGSLKKMMESFVAKNKALEEMIEKNSGTPEEITKLKSQVEELERERVKNLNDIILKQGTAITELKEAIKNGSQPGKVKGLHDEIKENMASLKMLSKKMDVTIDGKSQNEIVLKTLVQRSAITNNEQAEDLADIGQLAHRQLTLYDMFPKIQIGENNNGTVRYYDWDEASITRAAAAIAEGAAFPESVAKWTKKTIDLQKIGDSIPVTEEFFEDEIMFAAELQMFLITNVDIEIDQQLYDGDGTGSNLTGMYTTAPTFTAAASGITDASIYDLIVKMKEAITETGGSKYRPNFAAMNIVDINKMKLKKDGNNNYVLPPFVSRDGSMVDGITIIECNAATAGSFVLGDSRFGKVYYKSGVVVSKGYVADQFKEDEMTLKVRKRLALLIRYADAAGFIKCTNIANALATLAS